jgi:hypothetical protein
LKHVGEFLSVLNALIIDTKIGVIIKKVHLLEHIKIIHLYSSVKVNYFNILITTTPIKILSPALMD